MPYDLDDLAQLRHDLEGDGKEYSQWISDPAASL
jgi:hypothetical protein